MTATQPPAGPVPSGGPDRSETDADFEGSLAAMRRAALRARQVALQTGTDLILVRAGQLVRVSPQPQPEPEP